MVLPNFLIVGAQKSGTSTLKGYLCQHNDVFMPGGEAHFFDRDHNYNRGIEWYAELFKDASQQRAIGEKTPSYCYRPYIPKRIHKHLAHARLIWMLRDPATRAYSHYWNSIRNCKEWSDFEKAVTREMAQHHKNTSYLERGFYAQQIRRYLQFFPREQMFFVVFEDFVRDPQPALTRIYKFLGVNPDVPIKQAVRRNTGYKPRSIYWNWAVRQLFGNARYKERVDRRIKKRLDKSDYPPMKAETKAMLDEYFKEHNTALADLIGIDLSIWESNHP